jgi:enediyne biosynthesis protein E4
VLYMNEGGNRNHWLTVRLNGTRSNRSGLGAVVRVQSASGKQWATVHSGSSYCSQSELALTFGLAGDQVVSSLSVEWPSGARQQFKNIGANQFLAIDEATGIRK